MEILRSAYRISFLVQAVDLCLFQEKEGELNLERFFLYRNRFTEW